MSARFAGKVAIVTGAGSGIDRAIARRLASEGAQVIAVDLAADALDGLRGAVVNTVSISALKALPFGGAYSVSKAALAMLTRQAAAEYAAQGIRVNGVMPGVTDTPILGEVPVETMEAITAGIPQGRLAETDEVAEAVAFLASDAASYCNGTLLTVDGAATS